MSMELNASKDLAQALHDLRNHLDEIVAGANDLPPAHRLDYLMRTAELCDRLECVLTDAEKTILSSQLPRLQSPSPSLH